MGGTETVLPFTDLEQFFDELDFKVGFDRLHFKAGFDCGGTRTVLPFWILRWSLTV